MQNVGYVDVDDTLVRSFGSKRIPISGCIEFVKRLKESGTTLYCWSSGGAEYARRSAEELGIADCFEGFLSKPTFLVDDLAFQKWSVLELHPNEASSSTGDEFLEGISRAIP